MSKLDDIKGTLSTRGKSLLGAVADILESVTKQNLALASDVAGFTVAQVRLPTQANDFGDYRNRSKDAYSAFGGTLKNHGQELINVLREVPQQIKDAVAADTKVAKVEAPKAAPKAVKKVAPKAAPKAAKKAAPKVVKKATPVPKTAALS